MPKKPRSIIAQVDGSGTADTFSETFKVNSPTASSVPTLSGEGKNAETRLNPVPASFGILKLKSVNVTNKSPAVYVRIGGAVAYREVDEKFAPEP